MSEKTEKPQPPKREISEPISRVEFTTPIRFPDATRSTLTAWTREMHHERALAEFGPAGSIVLRGIRGATVIPAGTLRVVECFAPEPKAE